MRTFKVVLMTIGLLGMFLCVAQGSVTDRKISQGQLTDFLKFVENNEANWPTIIRAAEDLFNGPGQLPEGYQSLLEKYKHRETNGLVYYRLYDFREPGFYQHSHEIDLRVDKRRGVAFGVSGGIPDMSVIATYRIEALMDVASDKDFIEIDNFLGKPVWKPDQLALKSVAAVSECNELWTKNTLNKLLAGYTPENTNHDGDWRMTKVDGLVPINCATIEYNSNSVAVMYFLLSGEFSRGTKGGKLLLMSSYDNESKKITNWIYAGITNDDLGDGVNAIYVDYIADTNNDGFHDVVLNESNYARSDYIVLLSTGDGNYRRVHLRVSDSSFSGEGD